MTIAYSHEKTFTKADVHALFASVRWHSANYPERLHKALLASPTVLTAWAGKRLVGLCRAIDDGELVAFVHYVLVDPDYQGQGIASELIRRLKAIYADYLYIEVMPEESKNAAFYERHGFSRLPDGVAMQLRNG